jgi:hypothetical protein
MFHPYCRKEDFHAMTLSVMRRRAPHAFAAVTLSLLLAACGGGGGSDPASTATTYTVSTSAGTGGSISPASATVNDGDTASFTVTPDSGYAIDSVSGCGGSLGGAIYTTGAISADCTVTASFAAALPTVSVADASVVEGDSGTTDLTFTVSLSEQANGDVNVDYATSDGSATAGGDYTAVGGTLTIPAASTSADITVTVSGDTDFEPNETLTLTLSNVSANAALGAATATGTIINDDPGGLNDTGITACGDYAYGGSDSHQNNLDCAAVGATASAAGTDADSDPVPAGQDAHFGRDVTANDDSDGHAGFSFTKIDASGNALPASAASWDCVLDNVTGLMWEVKTDDGGLRDKDWTYTWYNADSAANGGSAGTANSGSCYDSSNCDTEKYVAQVNDVANGGICGYSDWRMPSQEELQSIADMSRVSPAIDTNYFPNTLSSWYWSASPVASNSGLAWLVNFYYGDDGWGDKGYAVYVRLVRAGQ